MNGKHEHSCEECGRTFRTVKKNARYCSRRCAWANNGSVRMSRFDLEQNFLDALVRDQIRGCWEWTRSRNELGYGHAWDGRFVVLAHRFSFEYFRGIVPDGLCVLHDCDNPPCCNPCHLFLGTRADNNADKMAKGRHRAARSSRNGNAKLSEEDVAEIIRLVSEEGTSRSEVARRKGVSNQLVSRIVAGGCWRHVGRSR